jgi:hypothetical protein
VDDDSQKHSAPQEEEMVGEVDEYEQEEIHYDDNME